jgi:signal transduction histidine kinase
VRLISADYMKDYEGGRWITSPFPLFQNCCGKGQYIRGASLKDTAIGDGNDQLLRLSNRFIAAQDMERRRISRKLHDGLGQELAVAKMMSDQIFQSTGWDETDLIQHRRLQ